MAPAPILLFFLVVYAGAQLGPRTSRGYNGAGPLYLRQPMGHIKKPVGTAALTSINCGNTGRPAGRAGAATKGYDLDD